MSGHDLRTAFRSRELQVYMPKGNENNFYLYVQLKAV